MGRTAIIIAVSYGILGPGRYTVECFEYSGVGHDKLGGSFTVSR